MHVDQASRHNTTADGERRSYPTYLRHSCRDEQGRPRKETLANLTGLPPESIEALRATLRGRTLVDAEAACEVVRPVSMASSVRSMDRRAAAQGAAQCAVRRARGGTSTRPPAAAVTPAAISVARAGLRRAWPRGHAQGGGLSGGKHNGRIKLDLHQHADHHPGLPFHPRSPGTIRRQPSCCLG
jgi:hypothetical protein